MAKCQTSCGQDSCLCSFLFLDLELTSAWLKTARQYAELAKKPLRDVVPKQLLGPCTLATLSEHETCFQQWNVLQLWIGIVSSLVIFVMNFIWFLAEDNVYAKPSMGTIIVNALVGILLTIFFTHLAWFGVVNKHGCCCFFVCCCLGKPNLLVTAIVCVVFGILAIITAFQALGSVQGALIIVVLVGALFALMHGVALLYVGCEAFMIWKLSSSETAAVGSDVKQAHDDKTVVRAAQQAHDDKTLVRAAQVSSTPAASDIEAGAETKAEVIL